MEEITIKAPAKINFGLNIINKRDDGYHNIETIFYPINLFDTLTIKISDNLLFNSNSEELNSEKDNLILKAVKVLEEYSGRKICVNIYLEKKIPIGAGLGGGSSDAAATLKALNNLFDLNLSKNELYNLAFTLGSDVPFFIDRKTSFAESRGEVLQEIDFRITLPILIVNPGIHISTSWAYQNLKVKPPGKNLISQISEDMNFNRYKNLIKNDFEELVFNQFPELNLIKEKMYSSGAVFSLMTGSGSTIFGIFPDLNSVKECENLFINKNYFTFIHHEN